MDLYISCEHFKGIFKYAMIMKHVLNYVCKHVPSVNNNITLFLVVCYFNLIAFLINLCVVFIEQVFLTCFLFPGSLLFLVGTYILYTTSPHVGEGAIILKVNNY